MGSKKLVGCYTHNPLVQVIGRSWNSASRVSPLAWRLTGLEGTGPTGRHVGYDYQKSMRDHINIVQPEAWDHPEAFTDWHGSYSPPHALGSSGKLGRKGHFEDGEPHQCTTWLMHMSQAKGSIQHLFCGKMLTLSTLLLCP